VLSSRRFARGTEPHLRHMEPEHLCLSPRGAPSEPQRNGRHAPAPPKSPRLGTFYLRRPLSQLPSCLGSRAEIFGERSLRLWSLGSLEKSRLHGFGRLRTSGRSADNQAESGQRHPFGSAEGVG
jgi:hypothetical protein